MNMDESEQVLAHICLEGWKTETFDRRKLCALCKTEIHEGEQSIVDDVTTSSPIYCGFTCFTAVVESGARDMIGSFDEDDWKDGIRLVAEYYGTGLGEYDNGDLGVGTNLRVDKEMLREAISQ